MKRRLFGLIAGYFVLAVVANAIAWWARFDERALELRHWDYGWELLLPWEASEGRWSGRDFVYPIGPLWQLIAYLPSIGRSFDATRAVVGMHLIFPLLSLATVGAVAWHALERPLPRALGFAGLGLLALHDDVRSFRAILPLAVLIAFPDPRSGEVGVGRFRRPALVGLLATLASGLSFDTGLVTLAAAVSMSLYCLVTLPRRAALATGFRVGAAIVLGHGVAALGLALVGGDPLHLVRGVLRISNAYGATMALPAEGVQPAKVVSFALLALLPLFVLHRRGDSLAGIWLAGAAPLALRGLVRSDAEHVYAALAPLAAISLLVALRLGRSRPAVSIYSGLLATLFVLGWFGSHRERPSAWQPSSFLAAERVLAGEVRPDTRYRGDFWRIRRWLEARKREGASCVGLPASAVALHAVVGIHGPTEMSLGWSAPLQVEMADAVRRARCPWFLEEVVSFDRGSWGFGPYLTTLAELYEPVARIGPDLVVARLRATPAPEQRVPLALAHEDDTSLGVPGERTIQFPRKLPWTHVLALDYYLEVPVAARLLGGMPTLEAEFFDGETSLGPPLPIPYPAAGFGRTMIPVDARAAELRWVEGRVPDVAKSADRMTLRARGGLMAPRQVRLALRNATELVAGTPPASAPKGPCVDDEDILDVARSPDAFFRTASPRVTADAIELAPEPRPEPDAELYVPIVPCKNSCLYAELGAEGQSGDGFEVEVHVIDGYAHPRLLSWHVDAGISPKPAELPLARWAGHDVLLRFGVGAKKPHRGRAIIRRPHVAACATLENLVTTLHDGRFIVPNGGVSVIGDTLRIEASGLGEPAAEVRVGVDVPDGACLAADVSVEGGGPGAPHVGVELGVVDGIELTRLARPELLASDGEVSLRELSLGRWRGHHVELRFAAWVQGEGPHPSAVIARPRIQRCGDTAPWGFGR